MPKLCLTYFDGRGRGELIRLALAQAGVEFEDKRIKGEDWPALKPNTPYGFLPILEVEGRPTLTESTVIAAYVAEENGLGGKDTFERALVRMTVELLNGLFTDVATAHFEKDETKKAELEKKAGEKTEKVFTSLEKQLKANKCGSEFLVGDKVTLADLALFYLAGDKVDLLKHIGDDAKKYPLVQALVARVTALPKIAEWVKKRPESQF